MSSNGLQLASFKNSLIKDPLSICFSKRFLILEKPKTKSKKVFWSSINVHDILKVSIELKECDYRGKTHQSRCTVINELTNESYIDYPVNILRYLKRIKYKQLDK